MLNILVYRIVSYLLQASNGQIPQLEPVKYLIVGDSRIGSLTDRLRSGTPMTKQVYSLKGRFHELHQQVRSALQENPIIKVVMLETWGNYFEISYEDRIKAKNPNANFKPSQRDKRFIPVHYRLSSM